MSFIKFIPLFVGSIFFHVNGAWAANNGSDFAKMKSRFEKTLACKPPPDSKDLTAMVESINCFKENISSKLREKDQTALALWLARVNSVAKMKPCRPSEWADTFKPSRLSPHFICMDVVEIEGPPQPKVVFFERSRKDFKLFGQISPIPSTTQKAK